MCGRCGARSWAGAKSCYACGQSLTANGQAVVPPGQPPTPFAQVPPAVPAVPPQVAARPFGIAILTSVEIVIGLVGLYVALDLFEWANWALSYGDAAEVAQDFVMAVAYLATSVAVFDLARALWSMQQWAWMRACLLSIVLLGLIVFSVFLWGIDTMDVVGIVVHLSVLAYLSTSSVRGLFGRSPTTFLQGPS